MRRSSSKSTRFASDPGSSSDPFLVVCRAALIFVGSLVGPLAGADTTANWDGATGNWTDATHWSTDPVFPNNNAPDVFDVGINAGSVTLDQAITINQLALSGGILSGTGSLTLGEGFDWTGGAFAMTGAGRVRLGNGSASTISGTPTFTSGQIVGGGSAAIAIAAGSTLTVLNQSAFFADPANPGWTFNNAGTFLARATSGAGFTSMDAIFNSTGTVQIEVAGGSSHTLSLAGGGKLGGTVQLGPNTTLELGEDTTLSGTIISGAGVPMVAGTVQVNGAVQTSSLIQAIGELRVSAGATLELTGTQPFTVDDGILSGAGTIGGDLDHRGGSIEPGASLGTLNVTGDVSFGQDSKLVIEIGGSSLTQFDRLLIGQSASLDGGLELRLDAGFVPSTGDSFSILTADGGLNGVFTNAPTDGSILQTVDGRGAFRVNYTGTAVILTAGIPEPTSFALLACGAFSVAFRKRKARKQGDPIRDFD